jgi:hypothetical protein
MDLWLAEPLVVWCRIAEFYCAPYTAIAPDLWLLSLPVSYSSIMAAALLPHPSVEDWFITIFISLLFIEKGVFRGRKGTRGAIYTPV